MQFGQAERFSRATCATLIRSARAGGRFCIADFSLASRDAGSVGPPGVEDELHRMVRHALVTPGLSIYPLTAEIAIEAVAYPGASTVMQRIGFW